MVVVRGRGGGGEGRGRKQFSCIDIVIAEIKVSRTASRIDRWVEVIRIVLNIRRRRRRRRLRLQLLLRLRQKLMGFTAPLRGDAVVHAVVELRMAVVMLIACHLISFLLRC